jgi:hypothetical protein
MAETRKKTENRLPINFHQTFIPERRYITALLQYAAGEKQGTDREISESTGIPTGQSSGKVPAIINYSLGMGLIHLEKGDGSKQRRPVLTDFGRIVLLEDNTLSEPLTQWLAHLNLCRSNGGAEIWHYTFGIGRDILGSEFSESELNDYLNHIFGKKKKSHIGPMLRTYEEHAGLEIANVFERKKSLIIRSPAPLLSGFVPGYSAFILNLWDLHFPGDRQLTLTDFEKETFWQRISGWSDRQTEIALEMMQQEGAVDVDRQMRPWVLTRMADAKNFWRKLYDKLA